MIRPPRIVLIGFSGTGKSSVAPLLAQALGWRVLDTDELVAEAAGKPIAKIFEKDGEERFRQLETEAIRGIASERQVVISAGGGAFLRPDNRRLLAEDSLVVCLESRPGTILERLQRDSAAVSERPLLAAADPLARIRELKASRQPVYALADCIVQTDGLLPEEVAGEVLHAWRRHSAALLSLPGRLERICSEAVVAGEPAFPDAACTVRAASGVYSVYVSWGGLSQLGQRMQEAGLTQTGGRLPAGRAFLISDDRVFARYGREAEAALEAAGIAASSYVIPAGEASKSLETAAAVYDWLVQQRAERKSSIVALGGGVVTDLAGYVAATYARGLPLVHVPTSLLAMVDAAIGGKVAVNHKEAKNLIGAFYQPSLVLADIATLRSLPPRELTSGWAEAIKHAFIADEALLFRLEQEAEAVLSLQPDIATPVIERSIAIKAEIVSQDEREETGVRTTLNYGHTVGHALEAASDYTTLLHGEAVAIGMMAAARISQRMGLLAEEIVERQRRLLERYGLPVQAPKLDRERLLSAMALDKKVAGGSIRWVLLEGVGKPVLRDDVPPSLVQETLAEIIP